MNRLTRRYGFGATFFGGVALMRPKLCMAGQSARAGSFVKGFWFLATEAAAVEELNSHPRLPGSNGQGMTQQRRSARERKKRARSG